MKERKKVEDSEKLDRLIDFGNDSNLKTSTNAHLTSPLLITPHISNDEVDNIDYLFQSFENWPVSYVEKLARFYSLFIRVKSCFI